MRSTKTMKKDQKTAPLKKLFPIIATCFIISGASSLILEVTWSKYFSLLLGGTIFGVATVVAAFMAGLGLGSYAGGRISARLQNHVRAYAWLEGIVGLFALFSPFLFTRIHVFFALFYGLSEHSFSLFLLVRFLFLFVLLMIPTTAMGASLPLLVEYFSRHDDGNKGQIGFLYAFNTIGAVIGTAVAGFLLVPKLGLASTTFIASIADLAIFAFIFMRPFPSIHPLQERKTIEVPGTQVSAGPLRISRGSIVALLFGTSGLLAMVYQIAWTRILIVPLGSSVYCFAIILFLFLIGLSLGAGAVAIFAERTPSPLVWFALFEGAIALTAYLGSYWSVRLTSLTTWAIRSSTGDPFLFFMNEIIVAAPIVLPPTLAMGALFPFAARAYRDVIGKSGNAVGTIYAANTLGTIIGALGAGFLLIPLVGGRQSILIASVASAAIAVAALIIASGTRWLRTAIALLCIAVAAGAILRPPVIRLFDINLSLVQLLRKERGMNSEQDLSSSSGISSSDGYYSLTPSMEKLVFYREGLNATVSVGADDRNRYLFINGKGDASTTKRDMLTQSMAGHIPMIFFPEAKEVLVIGLGSGVTTHAVLTYPGVSRVETFEIESAVVDASVFFHDVNDDFLNDPRHHLLIDDARASLTYTDRMYDIIISEPSNPWIAGINNLFTSEFYTLVDSRLRSGGIFCQWVQTYDISRNSIFVILRTITTVFPDAHIFYLSDFGDMLIIARKPPMRKPSPDLVFNIPSVAQDMQQVGVDEPAVIGNLYKTTVGNLLAENAQGIINTDNNCYLEHIAPLELINATIRPFTIYVRKAYFDDLHTLFYPELPDAQILAALGRAAARKGDLEYCSWALAICKDRGLSEPASVLQQELQRAKEKKKTQEQIAYLIRQAELLRADGKLREAIETLKDAGALDPYDNQVLSLAASYLVDFNQTKLAEMMYKNLIRRNDKGYLYIAHVNLGALLMQRGAFNESLDHFNKALTVNPYVPPAYYLGADALRNLGRLDEAIALVRKGLQYGFDDPALLSQLATLLEQKGSYAEARRMRRQALRYAR